MSENEVPRVIYIVQVGVYEDKSVAGVYSTEQNALDYVATLGRFDEWDITAYPVDDIDAPSESVAWGKGPPAGK